LQAFPSLWADERLKKPHPVLLRFQVMGMLMEVLMEYEIEFLCHNILVLQSSISKYHFNTDFLTKVNESKS
jgi:hypothetical protein